MHMKLVLITAAVCVLAFAGLAMGMPPGTQVMISYDGFLDSRTNPNPPGPNLVQADTLIVVTNSHPTKSMDVRIEAFDKYGTSFNVIYLLNGGSPLVNGKIPPNGFGWQTLSGIVGSLYQTHDPFGNQAGEKFSFRIYTTKPNGVLPVVEIKQVVFYEEQADPMVAIWEPTNFYLWTETALGGINGPGIVWEK